MTTINDLSITPLKNTRFQNKYKSLIQTLAKETIFYESQVTCYLLIYYKFALANNTDYMTPKQLTYVLQIYYDFNDRIIINHIIRVFSTESNVMITPTSWIKLLEIFSTESLDQQIQFCFNVYDIFQIGYLDRSVISTFVENFFIGDDEESEDYAVDLMETLMLRFDLDKDGIISFNDYRTTIHKSPKLLQFLGVCIPHKTGIMERRYFENKSIIANKLIIKQHNNHL